MTLLITISILIVLAVLLVTIWTTVKAYNVKHTIDSPQETRSDSKNQ
ncbi:YtzI protein [Bacillus spizizenii]|nr:YtzI protein [Bacillus spizizenii]MCY7824282.1 YtzI protein [Bacillus spizizenii]MCY7885689.1 YtzI protein [Bacillus spizizenii]MCY8230193.1 YtzI protein [Bacillus spizizenii]MCY8623119.1 YtzI protein [Bacillus spizizenii]